MNEVNDFLEKGDINEDVKSFIITGNEKAFAAGADIKSMVAKNYSDVYSQKFLENWDNITNIQKPIIAAVSGYALGGGFELAMMCDIMIASRSAIFGLPELKLGTIPGAGGTQRLIREIGKARAMEMILTSEFMKADEALKLGLVSRISEGDVLEEALNVSKKINQKSVLSTIAAKECVNKAYDLSLKNGVDYEKRVFWGSFATLDRKEGMEAFIEKRKPEFKNK